MKIAREWIRFSTESTVSIVSTVSRIFVHYTYNEVQEFNITIGRSNKREIIMTSRIRLQSILVDHATAFRPSFRFDFSRTARKSAPQITVNLRPDHGTPAILTFT